MSQIFNTNICTQIPFLIDVSYISQIKLTEDELIVKREFKNEKRKWFIIILNKSIINDILQKYNLTINDKIYENDKRILKLTSNDKLLNNFNFDKVDREKELELLHNYEIYPDYLIQKKLIQSYDNNWEESSKHKKSINLYDSNIDYLSSIFDQRLLKLLKKNYIFIPGNMQENIDHFTNIYRDIIKIKHNEEMKIYNYKIIDLIKKNNDIKILWGSCLERLKEFPCECVGLMTTSPPYYNARDYSIWKNLKEYLDDMRNIIKECYRVLDNHRVFIFNISDVVDNDNMEEYNCEGHRKIPLPAYFITIFEECGFRYIDDIIWDKGEVQSSRHKNKSKPWPYYQYPCNCYEHILVFSKHRLEKDIKYPCSDCGSLNVGTNSYTIKGLRSWECCNMDCNRSESNRGKRFSLKTIVNGQNENRKSLVPYELTQKWRRDIIKLNPVIKINNKKENKLGHTAPFPMDIPDMAIQYYSYKGDIVLDMFGGSFTTAISANKLDRIGVGIELRKDLFEECIKKNIESYNCKYTEI